MRNQKFIAKLLLAVICVSNIPYTAYANPQKPLNWDGILGLEISHNKDQDVLEPTVKIEWTKPDENEPGAVAGNDPFNPQATHQMEYYQFKLTDVVQGNSTTLSEKIDKNKTFDNVEKYFFGDKALASGKIYKISVIPQHEHKTDTLNGIISNPAPQHGESPYKYFITDFNTKAEDYNGKLKVSFEYIEGGKYDIYYVKGDYGTVEQINTTNPKRIVLSDAEAKKHIKITDGRQWVEYVIDETEDGQMYSAYVTLNDINNANVSARMKDIYKNENTDETGPKVARTTTKLPLTAYKLGKDKVRLEWKIPSWMTLGNKLYKTVIYERKEKGGSYVEIATIHNGTMNGNYPTYFEYREPDVASRYMVKFVLKTDVEDEYVEAFTSEYLYTPHELRDTPASPVFPKPYNSKNPIEESSKSEYLTSNDDISLFNPNFLSHTFHSKQGETTKIHLVWDMPMDKDKSPDFDVTYDIWIVKDIKQLGREDILPTVSNFSPNKGTDIIYKNDNITPTGIKIELDKFIDGMGISKPINSNDVYYIKVVAKKDYGDIIKESPATSTMITIDKNGDIFAPPIVSKPPLTVIKETTDSLLLEWQEVWGEVTSIGLDKYEGVEQVLAGQWQSKIYITKTLPYIRFLEVANIEETILLSKKDIEELKSTINHYTGNVNYYIENFKDRLVSIGENIKYESKVISYEEAMQNLANYNIQNSTNLSLEEWLSRSEIITEYGWSDILPDTVDEKKQFLVSNLEPNTKYIMFLRTYRELEDGSKQIQAYPSYIIGNTLPIENTEEALPTVPTLAAKEIGDTWVDVEWAYNKDFNYEFKISRTDNINSAKDYTFTPDDRDHKIYVERINDLFPETNYFIWIRTVQKNGSEASDWSNPVEIKTLPVSKPNYPSGLGVASKNSLLELGIEEESIQKDSLTFEWSNDYQDNITGIMSKSYSYVLEVANNEEFLDAIEVVINKDTIGKEEELYSILDRTIVNVKGLSANKEYYARIKTKLVLEDTESKKILEEESEYSPVITVKTSTSDDEYDGGANENIVIRPDVIGENIKDGVWTWEILNPDAVINQIKLSDSYYYKINLEKYNKMINPNKRVIKIPSKVITTLMNDRKEIRIVTAIGIYDIPASSVSSYLAKSKSNDVLEFTLTTISSSNHPVLEYPYILTKGENMQMVVRNEVSTKIYSVDGYISVALKTDGDNTMDRLYEYRNALWVNSGNQDNVRDGYKCMTFKTQNVSTYALYRPNQLVNANQMTSEMKAISTLFDIPGMDKYKGTQNVMPTQFVNLLWSITNNQYKVNMDANPTHKKAQLYQAGIFISGTKTAITQEQAIHGVVRMYEVKNKTTVITSKSAPATVSKNYRSSVAKAFELGLMGSIDPQKPVTYDQLYKMIAKVL